MSLIWQLAWSVGSEDTRQEFVELARQGEQLLRDLGGRVPVVSASSLTPQSDAAAFSRWTDDYTSSTDASRGMPLSVLFAGVSGWDPRADQLVMRLMGTNPVAWPLILQALRDRNATAALQADADWFASRAQGLATGNESQQLQERVQRAWWAELTQAQTFPTSTSLPTPTTTPTTTPGDGLLGGLFSGPGGFMAMVAIAAAVRGRKGRRPRRSWRARR